MGARRIPRDAGETRKVSIAVGVTAVRPLRRRAAGILVAPGLAASPPVPRTRRSRDVGDLATLRAASTPITSMDEGTALDPPPYPVDVVAVGHGLVTGQWTVIAGAIPDEYNGTFPVTVADADHFQYLFGGSGVTTPTGTITSTGLTGTRRGVGRLVTPLVKYNQS
jgi:hypothetical protein